MKGSHPRGMSTLVTFTNTHLLDEELLDAQVKVLVVILVQDGIQKGVDLTLVLPVDRRGV
jgi:hypothetical protein